MLQADSSPSSGPSSPSVPSSPSARFPDTYAEARTAWLAAVQRLDGEWLGFQHPGLGPDGEALWMDAAWFGAPAARQVLVVACGTHGIEGYAGSAVQAAWMAEGGPANPPADTAVLLIHAVNPWGFAHRQRVTEDNVDLNRNFRHHGTTPTPDNPGYDELHPQLALAHWDEEEIARAFAAMDAYRERRGEKAFSDAFNGGQYSRPDGIFFGGTSPCWANTTLRGLLRSRLAGARACLFLDLHTGIGPYGEPFLINVDPPASPARELALRVWGEEALSGKGSTHKALATFQGLLLDAFADELPDCRTSAVAIEFGTRERRVMQRAHLALMWLRRQTGHAAATPAARAARAEYAEAFMPSDPGWRDSVMRAGTVLCRQAWSAVADGQLRGFMPVERT